MKCANTLIVGLLAISLAACGGGNENGGDNAAPADSGASSSGDSSAMNAGDEGAAPAVTPEQPMPNETVSANQPARTESDNAELESGTEQGGEASRPTPTADQTATGDTAEGEEASQPSRPPMQEQPGGAGGDPTGQGGGEAQPTDRPRIDPETAQRALDELNDVFSGLYFADGVFFAGVPTEDGLMNMSQYGVGVIVDLLTTEEHPDRVTFDEPRTVEGAGQRYVHLPMTPNTFSVEDVDRFAQVMNETSGPVLVHCASSNRCGGLWAAYLVRHRDVSVDEAIAQGEQVGLRRDSMKEAVRRVASASRDAD